MKTETSICISACLCLLLCFANEVDGGDDQLLHLPAATLLVGYGPTNLQVTSPARTFKLQPTADDPDSWGHQILPTLSKDGRVVASARLKFAGREKIATFLLNENKWVEYVEVHELWSVSVSPDGSKLAFVSNEKDQATLLHLLDTKTGQISVLVPTPASASAAPSWSPDGTRVAYQVELPLRDSRKDHREYAINVVEVRTGKTWRVASGQNPSWSPSGEWIAYLDSSSDPKDGTKCMISRPDGSEAEALVILRRGFLGRQRAFVLAPVWSPDSTKLLLNELANWDKWTMNIHLLDLKTHKLTRKLASGFPVLGWAESK